jgi:hypothetical protein
VPQFHLKHCVPSVSAMFAALSLFVVLTAAALLGPASASAKNYLVRACDIGISSLSKESKATTTAITSADNCRSSDFPRELFMFVKPGSGSVGKDKGKTYYWDAPPGTFFTGFNAKVNSMRNNNGWSSRLFFRSKRSNKSLKALGPGDVSGGFLRDSNLPRGVDQIVMKTHCTLEQRCSLSNVKTDSKLTKINFKILDSEGPKVSLSGNLFKSGLRLNKDSTRDVKALLSFSDQGSGVADWTVDNLSLASGKRIDQGNFSRSCSTFVDGGLTYGKRLVPCPKKESASFLIEPASENVLLGVNKFKVCVRDFANEESCLERSVTANRKLGLRVDRSNNTSYAGYGGIARLAFEQGVPGSIIKLRCLDKKCRKELRGKGRAAFTTRFGDQGTASIRFFYKGRKPKRRLSGRFRVVVYLGAKSRAFGLVRDFRFLGGQTQRIRPTKRACLRPGSSNGTSPVKCPF